MLAQLASHWKSIPQQYKRVALETVKGALVVNGPVQLALVNDFGIENATVALILKYGSLLLSVIAFWWQLKGQTDYSIAGAASQTEGVVVGVNHNTASAGAIAALETSKFPDVITSTARPPPPPSKGYTV